MAWCESCEHYLTPATLTAEGSCPACGSEVQHPQEHHASEPGPASGDPGSRRRRASRGSRGTSGCCWPPRRCTWAGGPCRGSLCCWRCLVWPRCCSPLASVAHGLWRSLVSASVWGTEGREFKSPQPDKQKPRSEHTSDLGLPVDNSEIAQTSNENSNGRFVKFRYSTCQNGSRAALDHHECAASDAAHAARRLLSGV